MMFEEKAQIPENLNQINFESKVDENQNNTNNQEQHEHHENESLQPLQVFLQKSIEIIEGENKQEELVQQQQADEILPQQQQQTLASSQPDYISMINEEFKKYTKNSAQKNSEFNEKLSKILNKYGLNSDNTLFGSSICPDEINHGHSSLANLMKNTWGGIMPFGGLGGIPFAGKTGFKAYASHVPDDGNLLVLFAPHVGMDKYGQLGQVERRGQKKVSTSCGAASGAYLHALEESAHEIDGEDDYQLDWISKKMVTLVNRIKQAEHQIGEVTEIMYELVESQMFKIINTKFGVGKLVLVGGIQVNVGSGEDFFLPRLLQIHQQGQEVVDLSSQL